MTVVGDGASKAVIQLNEVIWVGGSQTLMTHVLIIRRQRSTGGDQVETWGGLGCL